MGVRVVSVEPVERVEVWSDGDRLARRSFPGDSTEARLALPLPASEVEVRVWTGERHTLRCTRPADEPLVDVQLAAPAGQTLAPFPETGRVQFVAFEGADASYAVVLTAREPSAVTLRLGGERLRVDMTAPGQREVITRPLPSDRATEVVVEGPRAVRKATLTPWTVGAGQVGETLALTDLVFPTDAAGFVDVARPEGRVTLPGLGWTRLLAWAGLGTRGQDRELPWGWHAVTLRNAGEKPLDVAVASRVLEGDEPAEAFRPVVRDEDGGTGLVTALLRIPAGGEATAVVPLFVTAAVLPEGASEFTHELTVTPLGLSKPVLTRTQPLRVSRGSSWVAVGFALALMAACLGVGSALIGVPRWLRTWSTTDLTTIAVFATLGFVITAFTAVLSSGLAAVLGPFSMLVTGLLSDCLRSALLATLIVLLPRRGTATVFLLLGWLMGGVALGAFSPTDFVFVGSRIFWLELFLWIAGLTRGGAWRDGSPVSRFVRLAGGFAGASLLSMAGSLASQIVLFRLYYAAWFVLLMLALPGFLYDVLACLLATSFAASLREVQS